MRRFVRLFQAGCWLMLCSAWIHSAVGQEPPKSSAKGQPERSFARVKRDFQQRIRTKKPSDRIAALKMLEDFPTGEAAELLYVTLLDDKSAEVRNATADFLAGWRERSEVTDKLLSRMNSASRKSGLDLRAVGAIQALAPTEEESLQGKLLDYLNIYLLQSNANQLALHEMIDTQSVKGDPAETLRTLQLLARTQLFDQQFGYRRCVVQGLMEVKNLDGITELIHLLPKFRGLVQADVIDHLVAATGQNFGDDADKWKSWWAENRDKLKVIDRSQSPPIGSFGNVGQYYGIPICAKRIVFVLDTSLSMRGTRIEAAKTELVRAIHALPQEVSFNVLAFDNVVRPWRTELVPATESNKRMAVNVVMEQPLNSRTCSFDALESAFELNPEAIFFLSDGAPLGGKIDNPAEILATVGAWNRVRRISIHSIGVGVRDQGAKVYADFLKGLAEKNWGIFKPVN
ncbi:MAG: VWA domain-containing protein [Planctomycetes bacterium]|nr:VWA domain-containing protein [Planctomycetota bacterium]